MSITLTETAAKHVIGSLDKRGKGNSFAISAAEYRPKDLIEEVLTA